jgi:type III secretion system YscQ/HrcQ family protein
MTATSTSTAILSLLPPCSRCQVVFDRLSQDEKIQRLEIPAGTSIFKWQGHHRQRNIADWVVQWSNGIHHIALWLKPSPGAWIFAQAYFDRLPAALAQSLLADAFQPFWAAMENGPWVAGPVDTHSWMPGGAHVIAENGTHNPAFEFELAFSSVAAASELAQCLAWHRDDERQADLPIACELHLGSLRLDHDRIKQLRKGDVLVGAVRMASFLPQPTPCGYPLARLMVGRRPIAWLQRRGASWKVAHTQPIVLSEHSMDEDVYYSQPEADGTSSPLEPENRLDLRDLRVRVDIVAGRLSLTVAAIEALRAGDVLEMPHSLDDAHIEIRAGGQPFASGTLVALEGRLAVQIKKISPPPPPVESLK